ncbi:MAG: hypothetical protein ICV74_10835 [Thermoleophilia bacterium]|nr:hypothetical protein [Thermoleophilia bacterium]
MADDWRLVVELSREDEARELVSWLREVELAGPERDRLGERVIVSREGGTVFLYADTEERARSAAGLVGGRLGGAAAAPLRLTRWHPVAQSWEDAAIPLPETEEERREEHERRQAREARASRRAGHGEWEVRVELPSHQATVEFAERLAAEGVPTVRRYTFVLVGAENEDHAHELAARLEREAPAGSRIEVEPGGQMVWEVAPANPFAVFGGLGA